MKEPRDAYKVLQVDPEADLEVIQAAYRRLAQKYHPDRIAPGADADAAALRMVELNAAWDQLRDTSRRSNYDSRRAARESGGGAADSPSWTPGPGTPPPARTTATAPRPSPWAGGPAASTIPDGQGSAGPPPGRPSGSLLNFGRYDGWSLGEIGQTDPAYLEWLDRTPIGRAYRAELDVLLRRLGRRVGEQAEAATRRGLFRRK